MTRICRRTNRSREAGFSLFELLAALFVMALLATLATSNFRPASRSAEDRLFVETFVSDLKRARLEAQMSGVTSKMVVDENSYQIEALNLERPLPNGASIASSSGEIVSLGGPLQAGATITLTLGNSKTDVVIEAITERITVR